MPTTQRIDYSFAANEGPNRETQGSPSFRAYGKGEIERQTRLNAIDEKVFLEACRIAGKMPKEVKIDYFGDQSRGDAFARVVFPTGKVVKVRLYNGRVKG